ncbi:hypothetical protein [Prochlorococcus sp. MIT 0604]|uniref:hypothetical protein n=1 Tax=Prochlorococcus sp. MIT 0604 TaxID=1501268 RepID=UPI0004F89419|nr:hypothetical protein [Prochlorococcus sp. MIT 0604]AIQ95494.1 putative O-antigen polymerasee [Prochlorococcus sp. MIT 0604]
MSSSVYTDEIIFSASLIETFNSFYILLFFSSLTILIFYYFFKNALIISIPIIIYPILNLHIGGLFFCLQNQYKIPIQTSLIIYLMTWLPVLMVALFISLTNKKIFVTDLKSFQLFLRNNKSLKIFNLFLMSISLISIAFFIINPVVREFFLNPRLTRKFLLQQNLLVFTTLPSLLFAVFSAFSLINKTYIYLIFYFLLLFFLGSKSFLFLPLLLFFTYRSIHLMKLPKLKNLIIFSSLILLLITFSAQLYNFLKGQDYTSIIPQLASTFDYIGGFNYFLQNNGPGITEGQIAKTSYLSFIPRFLFENKPIIYGHSLTHAKLVPELLKENWHPSFYESFSNYLADYGIFIGILMSSIAKFLLVIPIVFKEIRKNKTLFISYIFYMCNPYTGIITLIILSSSKFFKQKINIKENNEVNYFEKNTS